MQYMYHGILPSSDHDLSRVQKFAKFLLVQEEKLYLWGKVGWREVPSLADRYNIIV